MNYTLDKIEQLRREKNINVNRLCKATGVSQSTYTTWVAKDRIPQSKHLKPIAEYFNKPISYFYDDEKEKTENKKPAVISERELKIMRATELLQRYSEEDLALAVQMLERISPNGK